jgi:mediator of RNA polymerase II transcription subunit 31
MDEVLTFNFLISVLAQRGYFKDQVFINYLKYLLYWKEPEYARYLK